MQKLHILPSVFAELELEEKAFIIASIDLKIAAEKKQAKEAENKAKRGH